MLAFDFFGATEGGLFDINATLPLMAIQVVALTYILNSLFFKPVGNVVEKREKFVSNNIMDAKNKLSEVEKLEADLLSQLQSARSEAQKIVSEAENESDKLYKEALRQCQGNGRCLSAGPRPVYSSARAGSPATRS